MNLNRIDEVVALHTIEIWEITNAGMAWSQLQMVLLLLDSKYKQAYDFVDITSIHLDTLISMHI
jgi:hypothetical protein